MILDVQISKDGAGLPVVTWLESRGLHAPEALTLAGVECRVVKHGKTGALLFAARGVVGDGGFEEAKPWEQLTGFDCPPAQSLYHSSTVLNWRHKITGKSDFGALLAHDGAHVVRALFGQNELPVHINYADASPLELQKLQAALRKAFIENRDMFVRTRCKNVFRWPLDDDRVETYDPHSPGWPRADHGRSLEVAAWVLSLTIGVALLGGLYWLFRLQ